MAKTCANSRSTSAKASVNTCRMRVVDVGDDVEQVLAGGLDVLELGGQEVVALLQRGELLQRQRVDPAQLGELALGLLGAPLLGRPVVRHRRGRGDLLAALARLLVLGHLQLRRRQRHVRTVLGDQVGGRHAELLEHRAARAARCAVPLAALATSSRCSASVSAVDLGGQLVDLRRAPSPARLARCWRSAASASRRRRRDGRPPRSAARDRRVRTRPPRPRPPRRARGPRARAAARSRASRSAAAARRSESARPRTAFARSSAVRTASRASTSAAAGRLRRPRRSRLAVDGLVVERRLPARRCAAAARVRRVPRRSASRPASSSSRCRISRCHSSSAARASCPSRPSCS